MFRLLPHAPAAVMPAQVASEPALMRAAPAPVQTAAASSMSTAPRPISGVPRTRHVRHGVRLKPLPKRRLAQEQTASPADTTPAAATAPAPGAVEERAKPVASAPSMPTPGRRLAVQAAPVQAGGTAQTEPFKTKAQQPVDVFAALKQRAATALFERMGARFNDSTLTEQELRRTAREELIRIIDAEQVPLTRGRADAPGGRRS
jgi:hypothetical protein